MRFSKEYSCLEVTHVSLYIPKSYMEITEKISDIFLRKTVEDKSCDFENVQFWAMH